MGIFDKNIPDEYFDFIFSISVVEHVHPKDLESFFADCFRILKRGAVMAHAVDLYVFDAPHDRGSKIQLYRKFVERAGFEWLEEPAIDESLVFQCKFASNSDATMGKWNKTAPQLRQVREEGQSISLKLQAVKP